MRLALFGDPVAHSRSPAIHQAALAAVGIEGTYEAMLIDRDGLVAACRDVARGGIDGANVTMPWKRAAATHCEVLVEEAQRIGAVNTLSTESGRLVGRNTDVDGVRWLLAGLPAVEPVLVLGAGPAGAAAMVAAEGREIVVAARDRGKAESLARSLDPAIGVVEWADLPSGGIVVNATPLGMGGETLPDGWSNGREALIDMAYGEAPTPAVAKAQAAGLAVRDGIDMLIAQAAASFEVWTGLPAPVAVMEAAARGSSP